MLADACEFFIGQGCKVGLGGHLMGQKVTEQVAEMRSLPAGIDQRSPARHPDWLGPDDLALKIQEIREATNYEIPIQLKLGAARVYDDVRMAAKCDPDSSTSTAWKAARAQARTSRPKTPASRCIAAIPEARRAIDESARRARSTWSIAGGIRNGGDVAKALALGADAIAIGHSAMMALNCNKDIDGVTDYPRRSACRRASATTATRAAARWAWPPRTRSCASGSIADEAAERVYNFLHTLTMEAQMLARACGKTNIHSLEPEDLAALTMEASAMCKVPLAGTNYVVGHEALGAGGNYHKY